jgi:hypothetical protein
MYSIYYALTIIVIATIRISIVEKPVCNNSNVQLPYRITADTVYPPAAIQGRQRYARLANMPMKTESPAIITGLPVFSLSP